MPWYLYSAMAMLSFSAMMLIIRKIREIGFSSKQVNVFLFGLVWLGFLTLNVATLRETVSAVNFKVALLFLALASLFAIFANLADMTAVGIAPNPGYSQAIKNTNVLPIAIASIFLFGLKFTPLKFLGAVLVVVGIFFLVWKKNGDKAKKEERNPKSGIPWWIVSLGAVAGFTGFVLAIRYVTSLGFSSIQVNFFICSSRREGDVFP
jgi:drug/metabolite transporter (DMT)-like permease